MARMMREDLIRIAQSHGWHSGDELDEAQEKAIREDIRQALTETDLAPTRVFENDGSFRPMTIDEAVNNLIEELV